MQKAHVSAHKRNNSANFISFKQTKSDQLSHKKEQQPITNNFTETFSNFSSINPIKQPINNQSQMNNEIDFEELQDQVPFIDYNEFNLVKEDTGLLVIYACFNDEGELVMNNLENNQTFNDRLEEIIETVQRKYPLIRVIVKKPTVIEQMNKLEKKYGLFEMYLYLQFNTKIIKKVIYSKDLLVLLPTAKIVLENIKKCMNTSNLTIKLNLNQQSELSPHILKTQYYRQNQPTLENIQLSLSQKEKVSVGTSSMRSSLSLKEDVFNAARSREGSCTSGLTSEVKLDTSSISMPKIQSQNSNISLKQGIQLIKSSISYQEETFTSYVNQYSQSQTAKKGIIKKQNSNSKLFENNVLSNLSSLNFSKSQKLSQKLIRLNEVVDSKGVAVFKNVITDIQFYELKIHSSLYTKTYNMVQTINFVQNKYSK